MDIPKELQRSILEEAQHLISKDRQAEYGKVTNSFKRIADISSILCEKQITPVDICYIMIALKLSREVNKHKRDNLVDLAGYVGLMGELQSYYEMQSIPPLMDYIHCPSTNAQMASSKTSNTELAELVKQA